MRLLLRIICVWNERETFFALQKKMPMVSLFDCCPHRYCAHKVDRNAFSSDRFTMISSLCYWWRVHSTWLNYNLSIATVVAAAVTASGGSGSGVGGLVVGLESIQIVFRFYGFSSFLLLMLCAPCSRMECVCVIFAKRRKTQQTHNTIETTETMIDFRSIRP